MYAVYRPGGEDTPCTPCRTVKCAKVHCQAFQCTALAGSRVSVNLKYLQNQYIPCTVLYLCLYHTCTVFVWYVLGVQCGCHKNMPSNHGPSRPCRVTTVGAGLDKVVMCAMWKKLRIGKQHIQLVMTSSCCATIFEKRAALNMHTHQMYGGVPKNY